MLPLNLQPRYNGAPAQDFAACRLDEDGNRTIAQLRWGLVPAWAKDSQMSTRRINARAETVHAKPSFRDAFRSRRCLVPVNGWFEWQRTGRGKQPYFLALADGSPPSFAALWEHWSRDGDSLESFAIITTAASPALPHTAAEDLLELIMRRYERAATMLTSNRPVDDWGKLLGDTAAVTALLDRLLHHAHILKCGPRSWRTKVQTSLRTQEPMK